MPERTTAERLARLRTAMVSLNLDALWVPHDDETLVKFLPPASERLAWLTGFGGSAGVAIVMPERAAIFTDGRYVELLPTCVDIALFSCHHIQQEPPLEWLVEHATPGARVGFAEPLHPASFLSRATERLARADIVVVPLAEHPIDGIWTDRPAEPCGPVVRHDPARAGRSTGEKLALVGAAVVACGARSVVLNTPESICWLLNVRGADVPTTPLVRSFAVVIGDERILWFVDRRKLSDEFVAGLEPCIALREPQELERDLVGLAATTSPVMVDPARTNAWVVGRLEEAGATVVTGDDPCLPLKARKNPAEQDGARRAHRHDGLALVRWLAWLEREAPSGRSSELAAARVLEAYRRTADTYREPSFPTNVSVGPHAAMPHYKPDEASDAPITPPCILLCDSGGQYLDGTTDVTRTVAVGEPDDEQRRCFTVVLKAHIALATLRFPAGTRAVHLDTVARAELWRRDLDFDHGTGHGVGSYLSVHEAPPSVGHRDNGHVIEPGMIFSNEPGYYRAGAWGIRCENLVLVRTTDVTNERGRPVYELETLTLAPFDRRLVVPTMLDPGERAWLDAYHARVRDELGPLVDDDTVPWLDEATAPLSSVS